MHPDWSNGVIVPGLLAVITVVGLALRRPHAPELRDPRRFAWSAVAAGLVWTVIRGVAAYRQAQTLSWTPVLGGLVVVATSLVVRWLLLHLFRPRQRPER